MKNWIVGFLFLLGFSKSLACQDSSGFSSVQVYLSLLSNEDPAVREQTLADIAKLETKDEVVAGKVASLLEDPDPHARAQAVRTLIVVGDGGTELVAILSSHLRDDEPAVRRAVADALGACRSEAAAEALLPALRDEDQWVRTGALKALASLGPSASAAVPDLTLLLDDPNLEIVVLSEQALGAIGHQASSANLALRKLLESDNEWLRWDAVRSLGKIYVYREPPSAMARAFGVEDTRPSAAETTEIALALARHLDDGDDDVAIAAAEALGALGPWAEEAVGALRKATKSRMPELRREVITALAKLGISALEARENIDVALSDSNREVRLAALDYFEKLGPAPQSISSNLTAALQDPRYEIRIAAARVLSLMGRQATVLLPTIRRALALRAEGPTTSREEEALFTRLEKPGVPSEPTELEAIRILDGSGEEREVLIGEDQIPIAVASWCPYSRQLIDAIRDPALEPFLRDVKFIFVLWDEWSSVESHLAEMARDGDIPEDDVALRLADYREAAGGAPFFDPAWVESLPGKHYLATQKFNSISFPALYSASGESFEIEPKDWIKEHLAVPPVLIDGVWDIYAENGE